MKRTILLLSVLMSCAIAGAQSSKENSNFYGRYVSVPYKSDGKMPDSDKMQEIHPKTEGNLFEVQYDFAADPMTAQIPLTIYIHEYDSKTGKRVSTEKVISVDRSLRSQLEHKDNGLNIIDFTYQFHVGYAGDIFIYKHHMGPNNEVMFDLCRVFVNEEPYKAENLKHNLNVKERLDSFQLRP